MRATFKQALEPGRSIGKPRSVKAEGHRLNSGLWPCEIATDSPFDFALAYAWSLHAPCFMLATVSEIIDRWALPKWRRCKFLGATSALKRLHPPHAQTSSRPLPMPSRARVALEN
jgi:hypothetical protein